MDSRGCALANDLRKRGGENHPSVGSFQKDFEKDAPKGTGTRREAAKGLVEST
jgi:hypothetical protein